MLHPQELRSLVVGMQVQQWDDMKKVLYFGCVFGGHGCSLHDNCLLGNNFFLFTQHTQYRNGYNKEHPVILTFWEVFDKFTDKQKKEFLSKLCTQQNADLAAFC